jgi:hypothetical protein
MQRDTFRIAAPPAPQRAAFQEYFSAYSRSVMDGIPLDIEYVSFFNRFMFLFSHLRLVSMYLFLKQDDFALIYTKSSCHS